MKRFKKRGISLSVKNYSKIIKISVGVSVFLIFLVVINFLAPQIKNLFYSFSWPVEKVFWSAGEASSGYLNSVTKAGILSKENQNLKDENQKLLSQISFLQSLRDADMAQNDISLSCQNNNLKTIMAGTVGLDGQDLISINKGSADGIAEGMPVITQQNALFGKVFKVYKNFSQVMLISNIDSVVNVKVQQLSSDHEIDGIVRGAGGFKIFLDLVPVDEIINVGDVLVTSSLDGSFPKDILVGKILEVKKNDQTPHQQAGVDPFFDISSSNLFVITNYKRGQD